MNQELSRKHHYFAVDRLRSLMKDYELTALVTITNENLTYLNAYSSAFLELFRIPGLAMAALTRHQDLHCRKALGSAKTDQRYPGKIF